MNLNKQTLSEQIYRILRDDILSQKIPCNARLTLKMLQERFGVSSTPIREALTRLINEKLISYYSNVGVSVVGLAEDDLREIYQFIGDLDSLAIRYASGHPEQERLVAQLAANLEHTELCAPASREWKACSDEFHLIFYQYSKNSRLVHSAEQIRSQLSIAAYQYENIPETQENILREHRQIYDDYRLGDCEKAMADMRLHLSHSLQYALAWAREQAPAEG